MLLTLLVASAAFAPRGVIPGCAARHRTIVMLDNMAAAEAAALAAAEAAEKFAGKGGNGGDEHGRSGIEPVVSAAMAACKPSELVSAELLRRAEAAIARTNANAASVANAIVVGAAVVFGAHAPIRRHPITKHALYASLHGWTIVDWTPGEPIGEPPAEGE